MMKNKKSKNARGLNIKDLMISILVVLILIAIVLATLRNLGGLIFKGIERLVSLASKTDAVIIVALITGTISIVTVIISSVVAKIIEFKQQTKRYLYGKKEAPYADFVEMVYKMQKYTKEGKTYPTEELTQDVRKFSQQLTLWGSNKVIKKWLKFRKNSQHPSDDVENLFLLEDIIYEIRRDMGQKKGLKQGDILSFFVNDIDQYSRNKK